MSASPMLHLIKLGLLACSVALLAACKQPTENQAAKAQPVPFKGTDLTGATFGKDFHLTDHLGKARSLADFRGKAVALFFVYTHCPDVCPTTLSEMAGVARQLGKDSERFQVLFVTLDPERDTPQLLAKFVPVFHPTFLGLYGDLTNTVQTAQEFRVFYQKQPGSSPGNYLMDHFAGTYFYDPAGHLRLFHNYGAAAPDILHDVKLLLDGK